MAPKQQPQPARRVFQGIGIVASAGGLSALSILLGGLPANFPVGIVVLQHLDPRHPSHLHTILSWRTELNVLQAQGGECLGPGMVYIAPPNRHTLILPGGYLELTETPKVNFLRPSADLLFESMAESLGEAAIAVVLTGTGSDGSAGVQAVKRAGGVVIVQDLATAEFRGMPEAAIGRAAVDLVLPLQTIAQALIDLVDAGAK